MSKSNKMKAEALGMSYGAACNRLRKTILFSLICRLDLNTCFQCDGEILSVADLSIEHKEPWARAENPVESFFSLDNISFSHLSCNISAANAGRRMYHTPEEEQEGYNRRSREYRARTPVEVKKKRRVERYKRTGN